MTRARSLRLLAVALVAVTLAACGDGDDGDVASASTTAPADPSTTTSPETAPTESEGASPYTVTLEDPGQEPRQELRIRVAPGDVDRLTQRQETTIEVRAGDQVQSAPSPITELDLTHTVVEVDGERITAEGTYDDVRVLDSPGADPATVAQVRQLLSGFLDATAHTTYTARGGIIDVRLDGLELEGPGAAFVDQLAASITDSAESLSVPFPDEPVGAGARWRVDAEVVLAGLPVEVTSTVTLGELTDDRATGSIEQRMRFVPGPVDMFGTAAEVISGELTGGGSIVWDLVGGLTPRSDVSIAGTTVLEVNGMRIEQRQDQRISIVAR
jgi:hypothetical protein